MLLLIRESWQGQPSLSFGVMHHMQRFRKSLVWGVLIKALLWVIGTTGHPPGLHVRIFGWGHFLPQFIGMHLGIPAAASWIGMSVIQICVSTLVAYLVLEFRGAGPGGKMPPSTAGATPAATRRECPKAPGENGRPRAEDIFAAEACLPRRRQVASTAIGV
jgi:hypothetical protein